MTEQKFFTKNGSKLKFKKGDILIRSEEEPRGIYFLKSGIVKMSTFFSNGTEITYNLFKPGSFFPMMLALTEAKNSYDFQAVTDSTVYRVPKKEVLTYLEKEQAIYSNLIKRILIGYDGLVSSLPYLLSGNSVNRVAAALLILERRFGQKTKDGTLLNIKIRHEDLAGMSALTRETVSLTIGDLVRKRIILQKNRQIIVKKSAELKTLANMEKLSNDQSTDDETI